MSTTCSSEPPQSLRVSALGLDLSINACVLVFQMHSPLLVRLHNTMLRLFCYVRGDLYNRAFEVKIGKEESVAALKENIKEKAGQTFCDIDEKSLVLWNTVQLSGVENHPVFQPLR
jgi:Crinkler effector protein N-terminal domain